MATGTQTSTQNDQITSIQDLYLEQLRDLYSAENQIIEALPKMIAAAQNPQLKQGFELHLEQTKEQAHRLEQIFQRIGQEPGGVTCKAAQGLIAEGQEMLSEGQPGPVLDAGLIAAAQRIEHYEMAGYGTAKTLAKHVGDTESISLLEQTLSEEKETDEKLTQIAESSVNPQAAQQ
jgi:ferritin-like metal-binding protein YciE